MAKTPAWNADQVKTLEADYVPGSMDSIDAIAETLGKTRKQVIGKAVHLGIYVAADKPIRQKKDDGPTKGEIQSAIVNAGFDVNGLEGATKDALNRVLAFVVANKPATVTGEEGE